MADREIAAGDFKAKCLRLIDEVSQRRTELVVTKRGKRLAKLVPADDLPPPLFGFMRGTAKLRGDIVEPLGEPWEATGGDRR
jgi:prevent-host-death family protein